MTQFAQNTIGESRSGAAVRSSVSAGRRKAVSASGADCAGPRAGACFRVAGDRPDSGNMLQIAFSSIEMQRGEYGWDAPYALVIFGSPAVVSGFGAAIAWWCLSVQAARRLTVYFIFSWPMPAAFSTPPGAASSSSGSGFWIAFTCAAMRWCSIWDAAAARC